MSSVSWHWHAPAALLGDLVALRLEMFHQQRQSQIGIAITAHKNVQTDKAQLRPRMNRLLHIYTHGINTINKEGKNDIMRIRMRKYSYEYIQKW